MKFTMTKIAAAAILAAASASAFAAPQAFTAPGNFTMYDPTGAINGNFNDITGFVDYDAMTFGVASVSPFFGLPWTASGGTMFGPGSYTISTVDPLPGVSGGTYNVTVGAGQMGGHIDFAWGTTTGIDVLMVWNVVDNMDGTTTFTSVDTDADANLWAGTGMIDGPFPGFSANFSFTAPTAAPVPEASTYGMMLAGLGLVGFAVRRRKLMA